MLLTKLVLELFYRKRKVKYDYAFKARMRKVVLGIIHVIMFRQKDQERI
jgi:hypothetical protein